MSHGRLEAALRGALARGRKLLVPYVTGGLRDDWTDALAAMADAGADAIEVGIPFSDPVMDGPTIQEASARALERGATPATVFAALAGVDVGVPLVAMTYYNLVFRAGHRRFAAELARAGMSAAIVPDLPLEESAGWEADAAAAGIEPVLLAAPVTPDDRLEAIAARSRGFVYAVGLMGVTGERDAVAASAGELARRLKQVTDRPVLIGFGISTPDHAVTAAASADGVVVASALMRRYLDGASPEDLGAQVAAMRAALDGAALDGASLDGAALAGAALAAGPSPGCELCEAARFTTWYHEDDVCWVADCEACDVPMVVWRRHGAVPPSGDTDRMLAELRRVAAARYGDEGFVVDTVMRQIPDHFHAHARRRFSPRT